MGAARRGDSEEVARLVRADAMVEAANNKGMTSLMWAARNGHTAAVTTLVERHGARVEAADNKGMTSLMYAAVFNHTATVTDFIERHVANLGAQARNGCTALGLAEVNRCRDPPAPGPSSCLLATRPAT